MSIYKSKGSMFCAYIRRKCIHVRMGSTLCPLGIQKSNCGSALVEHVHTCHQHRPWRTTSHLSSSIPEIAEKPINIKRHLLVYNQRVKPQDYPQAALLFCFHRIYKNSERKSVHCIHKPDSFWHLWYLLVDARTFSHPYKTGVKLIHVQVALSYREPLNWNAHLIIWDN